MQNLLNFDKCNLEQIAVPCGTADLVLHCKFYRAQHTKQWASNVVNKLQNMAAFCDYSKRQMKTQKPVGTDLSQIVLSNTESHV